MRTVASATDLGAGGRIGEDPPPGRRPRRGDHLTGLRHRAEGLVVEKLLGWREAVFEVDPVDLPHVLAEPDVERIL